MTGPTHSTGTPEPSYTEAVQRLDEILERIEGGQADIDELSGLVEEAAGLLELCREKISRAEMQVKTITERLEEEQSESQGEPAEQSKAQAEGSKDNEVPF